MSIWLLLLLSAGCTGPTPETGETGETDPPDTAPDDRCAEPYVPEYGYVNLDYQTAECSRRGLFTIGWEKGYFLYSLGPRMNWQSTRVDFEEQDFPNEIAGLYWWADRGADMYPGETYLQALDEEDQPVQVLLADCPGEDWSSCTWFMARSGRVSIIEGGMCDYEYLHAEADELVFQEVSRDISAGTSTWVSGGELWCVETHTIDVPLEVM